MNYIFIHLFGILLSEEFRMSEKTTMEIIERVNIKILVYKIKSSIILIRINVLFH
jgi:hypothetical protein